MKKISSAHCDWSQHPAVSALLARMRGLRLQRKNTDHRDFAAHAGEQVKWPVFKRSPGPCLKQKDREALDYYLYLQDSRRTK